jgi:hypothetical protein
MDGLGGRNGSDGQCDEGERERSAQVRQQDRLSFVGLRG